MASLNGLEVYRLSQLCDIPEFVKSASPSELGVQGELPDRMLYADRIHSAYPCHTPAATWASCVVFKEASRGKNDADTHRVRETLAKFAAIHGITSQCQQATAKLDEEAVKIATAQEDGGLPNDAFAVVWTNDDGSTERHIAMRNAVEVVKAASLFLKHAPMFREKASFAFRCEVAEKILAKAAELQAPLKTEEREHLEKSACFGLCVPSEVVAAVRARAVYGVTKRGSAVEPEAIKLQELASALASKQGQLVDNVWRYKMAQALDEFDQKAGLRGDVARGLLQAPEDILFSIPVSQAAKVASAHTATTTGSIYQLDQVEALPLEALKSAFGQKFAKEFSADGFNVSGEKAAQIIPTLPRPDAEVFDQLMQSHGLSATSKEAAAGYRISDMFLREIRQNLANAS